VSTRTVVTCDACGLAEAAGSRHWTSLHVEIRYRNVILLTLAQDACSRACIATLLANAAKRQAETPVLGEGT
jgi:hypothetical protein